MIINNYPFQWLNEPTHTFENGTLTLTTKGDTDYWQRTHYGFRADNAHALLTRIEDEFTFTARCTFEAKSQYDQGGLYVRIDEENWIKISIEAENDEISRLGSVCTNLGYSDWATVDIPASIKSIFYRVSSKGSDLFIQYSYDGTTWTQMRICHMHAHKDHFEVGLYACSPKEAGGATYTFDQITIEESVWKNE